MSRAERTGWAKITPTHQAKLVVPADARFYEKSVPDGVLRVIVSKDDGQWHLSISHTGAPPHESRYPTWDEIHTARYEFCPPAAYMAMILPPKEEYVNTHSTTFHLWELPS